MASLTVTMKGQVTLKRDLLQHLGIRLGSPPRGRNLCTVAGIRGDRIWRSAFGHGGRSHPGRTAGPYAWRRSGALVDVGSEDFHETPCVADFAEAELLVERMRI